MIVLSKSPSKVIADISWRAAEGCSAIAALAASPRGAALLTCHNSTYRLQRVDRAGNTLPGGATFSSYHISWHVPAFSLQASKKLLLLIVGFIMMIDELNLILAITSHNKGMGKMLKTAPERIIPAVTSKL